MERRSAVQLAFLQECRSSCSRTAAWPAGALGRRWRRSRACGSGLLTGAVGGLIRYVEHRPIFPRAPLPAATVMRCNDLPSAGCCAQRDASAQLLWTHLGSSCTGVAGCLEVRAKLAGTTELSDLGAVSLELTEGGRWLASLRIIGLESRSREQVCIARCRIAALFHTPLDLPTFSCRVRTLADSPPFLASFCAPSLPMPHFLLRPHSSSTYKLPQWYYHTHSEVPSLASIARMVQTMLYGKRFFPYYAHVIRTYLSYRSTCSTCLAARWIKKGGADWSSFRLSYYSLTSSSSRSDPTSPLRTHHYSRLLVLPPTFSRRYRPRWNWSRLLVRPRRFVREGEL